MKYNLLVTLNEASGSLQFTDMELNLLKTGNITKRKDLPGNAVIVEDEPEPEEEQNKEDEDDDNKAA